MLRSLSRVFGVLALAASGTVLACDQNDPAKEASMSSQKPVASVAVPASMKKVALSKACEGNDCALPAAQKPTKKPAVALGKDGN